MSASCKMDPKVGYVYGCHIYPRKGDGPLFTQEDGGPVTCCLECYVIRPIEDAEQRDAVYDAAMAYSRVRQRMLDGIEDSHSESVLAIVEEVLLDACRRAKEGR